MMLDPAKRLVKHSSTAGLGEGRMISMSTSLKFEPPQTRRLAPRTRSDMTLDGSIADTGLSDSEKWPGLDVVTSAFLGGAAGNRTRSSTRQFAV
jgi:hypothetical protein